MKYIVFLKKNVIIDHMKKIIFALTFCLSITVSGAIAATEILPVQLDIRNYDGIEVPAGTFIPVASAQEISTQYCQDGYKVKFISTNDLFMHETNIIPLNTAFYGYVEDEHDPIVGTNASLKIKIIKMVLPDGFEIPIQGYIYTSNNNIIGGELSEPAEWIKMPHYQGNIGINTTLQIRPGRARKMGSHTVVPSGEDRLIILTDTIKVTHTLTN